MNVALLTIPQARSLWQKQLGSGWYFNPVMNKDGNILISEQEINAITNPDYDWVKLLPLVDVDTIKPPSSFSPPAPNGIGLVVAAKYQWVFPIYLDNFVLDLKSNGTQFYVDASVADWVEFKSEMNKPQNKGYKDTLLSKVIDYLKNTAVRINV